MRRLLLPPLLPLLPRTISPVSLNERMSLDEAAALLARRCNGSSSLPLDAALSLGCRSLLKLLLLLLCASWLLLLLLLLLGSGAVRVSRSSLLSLSEISSWSSELVPLDDELVPLDDDDDIVDDDELPSCSPRILVAARRAPAATRPLDEPRLVPLGNDESATSESSLPDGRRIELLLTAFDDDDDSPPLLKLPIEPLFSNSIAIFLFAQLRNSAPLLSDIQRNDLLIFYFSLFFAVFFLFLV